MASPKPHFIKIPVAEGSFQTMPVNETNRVADSEIQIQMCEEADAYRIAQGLYTCFPDSWWLLKEPLHLRPPTDSIRVHRLAKRIAPSISQPGMHWLKAVHTPSNTLVGAAGWAGPDLAIHNIFRRDAISFFRWEGKMQASDAEIDELFAHVDDEQWSAKFAADDETRRAVVEGQPHWYLAPLIVWPEWQGRGVGSMLLDWAIEKADREVPQTRMYLESRPQARAVYMHVGFEPVGEYNFLRRGPKVVRGLEGEGEGEDGGEGAVESGAR